jgi:phosphoribosyl-AMP cyclohydrolase
VHALEEGTSLSIDFEKIRRAARSPQALVPAVLQHADTSEVLFVGYANRLALDETLRSKKAVLWSASRDELWRKGASSGDELELVEVRVNCEQNSLLYLVRPVRGGVCHTVDENGATRSTCFYRRVSAAGDLEFVDGFGPAGPDPSEPDGR